LELRALWVVGCLAVFVPACAEDASALTDANRRRDGSGTGDGGTGGDGGGGIDVDFPRDIQMVAQRDAQPNWDAFFAMDPAPTICLPDGGRMPGDAGPVGGTPECPNDRNREGCPCDRLGETAPCWPGLRVNRNRGACHDGMTTCQGTEFGQWGPCMGHVLPVAGARGAPACNCFSSGRWEIPNIVPCFIFNDMLFRTVAGATSSIQGAAPSAACGPPRTVGTPLMRPAPNWSTNTLAVDCGGVFRLCYRLRSYASLASAMSMTRASTDCTMAESCTTATVNPVPPGTMPTAMTLPPLPGWETTTPAQVACAQAFRDNGGYGEMTVNGLSTECQQIDDGMRGPLTFNSVNYCPLSCSIDPPATRPAYCAMCSNGSAGMF